MALRIATLRNGRKNAGDTLARGMSRKGAGFGIWGSHNLTPLLVSVRGMESKITGMVVALLTCLGSPWVSALFGLASESNIRLLKVLNTFCSMRQKARSIRNSKNCTGPTVCKKK